MDIKELRRLSAQKELSLNFIAKDEKISELLTFFQEEKNIVLKGGTAINRVYLKGINSERFSEDIDFDYFTDSKQVIKELNGLMKKVEGFKVEKPRLMKSTVRYDLYYINPLGQKDRIMVEFKLKGKEEKRNFEVKIVDFGFVPAKTSLLQIYRLEELVKMKLEALCSRTSGKDIYDLFYLMDIKHVKISGEKKQRIIKKLDEAIANYTMIQNSMNHYIAKSKRPDWRSFILELKEKIEKI